MGTMTPAAKRKKPRDPVTSSKPYQWLAEKERKGAFKRIGMGKGTPIGAGLDRRLDRLIGPTVERIKKKIGRE